MPFRPEHKIPVTWPVWATVVLQKIEKNGELHRMDEPELTGDYVGHGEDHRNGVEEANDTSRVPQAARNRVRVVREIMKDREKIGCEAPDEEMNPPTRQPVRTEMDDIELTRPPVRRAGHGRVRAVRGARRRAARRSVLYGGARRTGVRRSPGRTAAQAGGTTGAERPGRNLTVRCVSVLDPCQTVWTSPRTTTKSRR